MFVNLRELEGLARGRVAPEAFDYVVGGAGDEATLRENASVYGKWRLRPRVLRDISKRDLSTTVLGTPVSFPVLAAPTAFHKLMHPDGEKAAARGVHGAGTLFVNSTLSTTPLEEVAAASEGPKWFQLYVYKDRELTLSLINRAKAAGFRALVLTVDTAVWGRRERDVRNGFSLPPPLALANFANLDRRLLPDLGEGKDGLAAYVASQLDPTLTWSDVRWLREVSGLPVLVKGVVTAEDARLAVEHGAAGIIVSNHGGRQLDAGVATLDALPEVVEAVGGRCEVFVDGGVRRGTDVMIALSLGARAVLVGRPIMWSLAIGGQEGVTQALNLLKAEFDTAMALCGLNSPLEATRDLVRPA
ncbi:MAG TPA: alpha-hydroxy acid oxidase [Candidatus Thermoplasmatota archaeon]|nr:alpha-hydroxy acid oxidase [Candidatus Thermoplasmatota archaeon]